MFHDGFESDCQSIPCGWTVEQGQAFRVTTFHEGEHGLYLTEGARVRRTVTGAYLHPDTTSDNFVEVMARCDPGTGVRFTVIYEAAGTPAELTGDLEVDTLVPGPLILLYGIGLGEREGDASAPIQEIVIELIGEGACLLDGLSIRSGPYSGC